MIHGKSMRKKTVSKSKVSPGKSRTLKITKRRKQQVYKVDFPKGEKTGERIKNLLQSPTYEKINFGELPDEYAKITFYAEKNKKEKQAMTVIYQIDDLAELPDVLKDIWSEINKPTGKQTKTYMRRLNKYKNYLSSVTIDFETAA